VQPDISPPSSDFVEECRREEQNCLHGAASLHIWARFLRVVRIVFIVFPLVLGAIAGWSVLEQAGNVLVQAVVSFVALVEGVIPALFASLKIDGRVDESVRLEAEYTNLGDRFRQAALNASHKSSSECEMEFRPLMKRLEVARRKSAVPDWCVKKAEAKLKHVHHNGAVSEAA
jgi:hypothetical protein